MRSCVLKMRRICLKLRYAYVVTGTVDMLLHPSQKCRHGLAALQCPVLHQAHCCGSSILVSLQPALYIQLNYSIAGMRPATKPSSRALVHGSFAAACCDSSAAQRTLVCEVPNTCTETGSQAAEHRVAPSVPETLQGGQVW